mmetsp:Transcript_36362/g.92852  ORF Transcript_36362/g.92852 Transcript_36362/m.92852 type:complete len:189 (-) Transcript_36362:566-1132(-)
MPKVDVRDGGTHAHWLWRGSKVSDKHIGRYCAVKLELDDTESGMATVVKLWGGAEQIQEAKKFMSQLLSRSQLEAECFALGLGDPQYINVAQEKTQAMSCTVVLNTMDTVEWSFVPTTLTRSFTGDPIKVRGMKKTKDIARAAFFSQASAAANAADQILGPHRPKMIEGPLPAGLDPGVMWQSTGYTL